MTFDVRTFDARLEGCLSPHSGADLSTGKRGSQLASFCG